MWHNFALREKQVVFIIIQGSEEESIENFVVICDSNCCLTEGFPGRHTQNKTGWHTENDIKWRVGKLFLILKPVLKNVTSKPLDIY